MGGMAGSIGRVIGGIATGGLSEIGFGVASATGNGLPNANATVKQDTSQNTGGLQNFGFGILPPADPPSLTDASIRQRRAAQAQRQLNASGRRDSFLSGGYLPSVLG